MAKITFDKIFKLINPKPKIGGLEISDSYVRFVLIVGKKVEFFSTKLPPGVVEDGKLKDKDQFRQILLNFHNKIAKEKDKIHIIAGISDSDIYMENFTLPKSAYNSLDEAAQLNLQMISPIDFNSAYSDWHILWGGESASMDHFEVLGAFAPKSIINDYEEVLSQAGFEMVAIEFPMLALTRTVIELGEGILNDKNYLLMRVGSDGLSFGLIRNGDLYFLHFISWTAIYGEEKRVSLDSLEKVIIEEVQKVLSFHETHSSGDINEILLISPTLINEISKVISENFSTLSIKIPTIKQFANLTPAWFSVLGSALRGAIPRNDDKIISLASTGTEDNYSFYEYVSFVKMLRNISATVLAAILILFVAVDLIFAKTANSLTSQSNNIGNTPEMNNLGQLEQEARDFNQKVDLLSFAQDNKIKWSSFFGSLNRIAGTDISINRIFVQSASYPVLLVGQATSQEAIINFKNDLTSLPQISSVNFQPSSVTPAGKSEFNFSLSFSIKDPNNF